MASNLTKRLRRARGLCEQCAQPAEYGERTCPECVALAAWVAEQARERRPAGRDLPPLPRPKCPALWRTSRERLDYGDW